MSRDQCTLESFLKDIATHEVTIVRDEGLYRHITAQKPKDNWDQRFSLVTFPGTLVYTGDMGTYVFSRIPDMFAFFRQRQPGQLAINPSYWAEKVDAESRFGNGIRQWSGARFRRIIEERLDAGDVSDELRQEVEDTVLIHEDDGEITCIAALRDFKSEAESKTRVFEDIWDGFNPTEYTYHYIWCCYAIAWAVGKYDAMIQSRTGIPAGNQAPAAA